MGETQARRLTTHTLMSYHVIMARRDDFHRSVLFAALKSIYSTNAMTSVNYFNIHAHAGSHFVMPPFDFDLIKHQLQSCISNSIVVETKAMTHLTQLKDKTSSSAIAERPRCGGELWQNISAKIVHLISLYPTALTSTNHHFTVSCHPTCT